MVILRGRLVVIFDFGDVFLVLESIVNIYNDGNWYYVFIMKMGVKYVGWV